MSSFSTAFSPFSVIEPTRFGKLYLVTNEAGSSDTLNTAMRHPVESTVVLFTSGMFALNYASIRGIKSLSDRRIQHLISMDNSTSTKEFWNRVAPLICDSTDRSDCTQKIIALIKTQSALFFPILQGSSATSASLANVWVLKLHTEIESNQSWLCTDERYAIIKSIFVSQHFVHLPVDLCSSTDVDVVSLAIANLDLKLDSLYLSNISEYVEPKGQLPEYRKAIQCFRRNATDSTFFVDTVPRNGGLRSSKPLQQRIRSGIFLSLEMEKLIPSSAKDEKINAPSDLDLPHAKSRKLKQEE